MTEKGAKNKFKVENDQVIAQCSMAKNTANLGEVTEKEIGISGAGTAF